MKKSSSKTPKFEALSSPLIESLRLAMEKQKKRKFSGKSAEGSVTVRVNGHHEIESIEIENSGLSQKKEKALIHSLKEASNNAIQKAQRAARRDIVAGTRGESRTETKKRAQKIAEKEKKQ